MEDRRASTGSTLVCYHWGAFGDGGPPPTGASDGAFFLVDGV
jgi:hypothetical protein